MRTIKEIYAYREMIFSLVRKDLRGRYKGSVLGFLWTFLNPLLQLLVYTMLFSVILRMGMENFYLYLFIGLIPWLFFSSSISFGATSITSQKDMVSKIYFPREVLPISYVTSCFVNMLLCFVIVFAAVFWEGVALQPLGLLCLPVIMIVEYIMALGMAMLVSAVTVYFRDLEHILGILTMAWMYLTPIIYPISMVPEQFMFWFKLNPMYPVITAYQDVLYYGRVPEMATLGQALAFGLIVLLIGWLVFSKLKVHFAEEL